MSEGTWYTTSDGERLFIPATGWLRRVFDGIAGARPTLLREEEDVD